MLPTILLSFTFLLPAAAAQNPQDDIAVPLGVIQDEGDYYTLDLSEVDEGGLTLRQFVKICQINTGLNFTLDESASANVRQKLDNKKLLLYGTKRIHKDDFYSFFQIMMKINGFVCVQQGSGDLAVVVIVENIGGNNTGVVTRTKPKTKKPSMYKVLMLNDDFTPMEFVVHVLERFFSKGREEATTIMLHVHRRGVGVCGVFPYEIAETKVTQVMDFARQHQHPLRCTLEKD